MDTTSATNVLLTCSSEEEAAAWLADHPAVCTLALVLALRQTGDTHLTQDLMLAHRAARCATLVAGRVPAHEQAHAWMEAGWSLGNVTAMQGTPQDALQQYMHALEYARLLENPLAQARLTCNIGITHYHRGDYATARHCIEQARSMLPADAPPLVRIGIEQHYGVLLDYMGDTAAALDVYSQAVEVAQASGITERLGELLCNRAYVFAQQGNLAQAETDFHTAHALTIQQHQPLNTARIAMNLGELYLAQGRLVEAQTMLHQAYAGFEAQGDRWNGAVVQIHQSRLYRTLGLSHEALTLAQAAVATLNDQDWQEERGLSLMELLRAQRQAGKHTQAAATIAHALELWTRLGTTLRVAETLGERAMLAIERHHYAAALSDAKQARERFAASGEPRPLWASPARLAEVMALLHLGEPQAARQTCAALLHDARTVGDHWTMQTALTLQAQLDQAAGRFAAALDTMTRAANDLELVRRTLTAEELKARFLQQHTTVYDMLVTLAASSGDAAATLRAMLRAKGGGIRDMLQRDRSNRSLPAAAQRELEDLRRQLAWQRAQHQPASTHTSRHDEQSAVQEQRILELLRQRQQQLDQPGDDQPPLTPATASIAACLPSDGALLEYYLADTTLWGVLLHADGTCHLRLLAPWGAAEHELLEELDLFFAGVVATSAATRAARPPRQEPVQKRLQTLWQKLIAPWGDLLPVTLCIAPHGSLGSVPFAALWDGTRYLGETHTIATMPSGVLLASPASPYKVDRRPQTADCGSGQPPDDLSGSDAHPALVLGYSDNGRVPGVLQEAQVVGQMVPGAQVAMEAHAHSQVLRSLNVPPLLLHIAAHAEVRRDAPLFSFIRLSDGNMALESWYDLPLHATQLVVLSACNTGRIADPGGPLLAFQGALLGAGVQTLVSSLWEANDDASERLMREFYQAWLHGTPPAQALWQAQHVLRTQAAFAHPALWAPFICGGPGALKEPYTSGIAR